MKITIVGCGSVGFIHGYYFASKGHEVSFLKTSEYNCEYFNKVKEEKEYLVTDRGAAPQTVKIKNITRDPANVIPEADIVFIATTTLQHMSVAQLIYPYLTDGQVVCLMPSYASSFLFKQLGEKQLKYVEFETTLYNGRIKDNAYVNINFKNCRMAAYFDGFTADEKECFKKEIIFIDKEAVNSFEIAFHNPNMIVHTIGVLLSASRIEYSQGEFWMYKEAFTPSVVRVIENFDKEKNQLLKKIGCKELTYFDAAKWRNEEDLTQDSLEVFRSFAEDSNKGPAQLKHRYLLEDVPMGLVLFSSLGDAVGVNTKIADAVITLTSSLLAESFWEEGRTLEKLLGANFQMVLNELGITNV